MAPVYEWGHNKRISVDLIYKQNKNILMMKTDKGKEAFRRIRKCIYYTVCLFATGLLVLCNDSSGPDDKNSHPASISLEGTKWRLAGIVDVKTDAM
jgi:hypothetical protein